MSEETPGITPENIEAPEEKAYTGDSIDALEKEARKRQKARIKTYQKNLQEKEKDLNALIKAAQEKTKIIQGEQVKLALEKKKDLDALLKEAEQNQKNLEAEQKKELEERRHQISLLADKAEARLDHIPPEQREQVKGELNELLRLALEKQKNLEKEQRKNAEAMRSEIVDLSQKTEGRRQELLHTQKERLKNYLNGITELVYENQQTIRSSFEGLVDKEKEDLDGLVGKAKYTHEEMLTKHTSKMEKNEQYIDERKQKCTALLREGKPREAQQLLIEIREHIQDSHYAMQKHQHELTGKLKIELKALEEAAKEDAHTLEQNHDKLISAARTQMVQQGHEHLTTIRQEMLTHTKENLSFFGQRMRHMHQDVHNEQISIIQSVQSRMEKQAEDISKRQRQEHEQMISQTKEQINELEKRAQGNQMRLEQDQDKMVESAKTRLDELDFNSTSQQKDGRWEQKKSLDDQYRETSRMAHQVKTAQEDKARKSRQKITEEMVHLGRSAHEVTEKTKAVERMESVQTRKKLLSAGKGLKEHYLELQNERQALVKYEQEKTAELSEQLSAKKEDANEQLKEDLRQAKAAYEKTVGMLETRKSSMNNEKEELDGIIKQAQKNLEALKKGGLSDAMQQEQNELMELVKQAVDKQKEIELEQQEIEKEAKEILGSKTQESEAQFKSTMSALSTWHEEALVLLEKEIKAQLEDIRKEQKKTLEDQEEHLNSLANKAEEKHKIFKEEQNKIVEQTQEKLKKLQDQWIKTKPEDTK
jgi:hypothetical protein